MTTPPAREPEPVRSPLLDRTCHGTAIRHGYFSRRGGVSDGLYHSLNVGLGSSDSPHHVAANRARVATCFGLAVDRLATVHQIHSPDVHVITRANVADRPKGDAMVTREPGLLLGVLTADCGPVLFADPVAGVIAAAHAGWRGALDGVLENTIAVMQDQGAERSRIVACLGPSISQANYEVGPEFMQRFLDADADNAAYFAPSPRAGHALFDLRGMTIARLRRAGVSAELVDSCTYADETRWFSYRRATHRNEADYGRQMAAIALMEDAHGASL
ncbi:peptidoglycan editing factor PgeF [Pseudohoeflea coraliihabitans]|uniref:Purine nucleoside phosphorylase n=1 Tax=Pseudohoeflea coraliihabitans TaxID=2860393 RepID=A0ABS6WJR1_9HYPH|nr:peptidoglycan editing factor PgeF [Pseudohoeflea sp. DP4N28-3]MBW3096100.1 peptidoglycan editing factor PgeF [Pseudohoeflea sp. DP4N28-3]